MQLGKINKQDPQYANINDELNGHILVDIFREPGNTNDSIVTMTVDKFNELKALDDTNLGIETAKSKVPDLNSKIRSIDI